MKKFSFLFLAVSLFLTAFLNDQPSEYNKIFANKQFKLGFRYFSAGKYDKASVLFEKAHTLNRADTYIAYWLAKSRFELFDFARAREYAAPAQNSKPSDQERSLLRQINFFQKSTKQIDVSYAMLGDSFSIFLNDNVPAGSRLNRPSSIFLGANDEKYILSSANNMILVLNVNNNVERRIFLGGSIKQAYDFVIDNNRIYVSDFKTDKVFIYDMKGRVIKSFGAAGSKPGMFLGPKSIYKAGSFIFIADSGNNRVQEFDESGNLIQVFSLDYSNPTGIVVYKNNLYVTCNDLNDLKKSYFVSVNMFTGENKLLKEIPGARGLSRYKNDIIISTYFTDAVYVYDMQTGEYSSIKNTPQFSEKAVFNGQQMYIADFTNNKILVRYDRRIKDEIFCNIDKISFSALPIVHFEAIISGQNGAALENLTRNNFTIYERGKVIDKFNVEKEEVTQAYYTFIVDGNSKPVIEQLEFLLKHFRNEKWRILSYIDGKPKFIGGEGFDDKVNLSVSILSEQEGFTKVPLVKSIELAEKDLPAPQGNNIIFITNNLNNVKVDMDIDKIRQSLNFYGIGFYVINFGSPIKQYTELTASSDGAYFHPAAGDYVLIKTKNRHYRYIISYKSQAYDNNLLEWAWFKVEINYKGGFAGDYGGILLGD